MADADSITTDSNVISRRFGLPRISIPKDYAETDGSVGAFESGGRQEVNFMKSLQNELNLPIT